LRLVGTWVDEPDFAVRAFLWRDRVMVDLNDLIDAQSGWVLETAEAINDRGQIAGRGAFHGGTRGFLLAPIRCAGSAPTIAGTPTADALAGTRGRDIIAGLGASTAARMPTAATAAGASTPRRGASW
jgi:hypothetical protein